MESPKPEIFAYMAEFKESIKDVVNAKIEALKNKYLG